MSIYDYLSKAFYKFSALVSSNELHYTSGVNSFEQLLKDYTYGRSVYLMPETNIVVEILHNAIHKDKLAKLIDVIDSSIKFYSDNLPANFSYNDTVIHVILFNDKYDYYNFLNDTGILNSVSKDNVAITLPVVHYFPEDRFHSGNILDGSNILDGKSNSPYVLMFDSGDYELTLSHEIVHCMQFITGIFPFSDYISPFYNINLQEGIAEFISSALYPNDEYWRFFDRGVSLIEERGIDFYSLYTNQEVIYGDQIVDSTYRHALGTVLSKFLYDNHPDMLFNLYDSISMHDYYRYHDLFNKAWEINQSKEFQYWIDSLIGRDHFNY